MTSDRPTDTTWPAVGRESHLWVSRYPPEMVSRSVRERHSGPYDATVPPAIAGLTATLPMASLAMVDEATIEIARFDAELGADIAPFAALLLRSESTSSSRIENLTAGAKAIALAELGRGDKRNATEIVANVRAMHAAIDLADRLDEQAVLSMHTALMSGLHPDMTGRWRREQVWIGGSDFGPHDATFVPPHADRVQAAMVDLLRFVRRDDIPVLAHAALAHAQFETVHPFPDGNGRTGRALVHAMLRGKGLTRHVTVPVSAGLLADTEAYFDALTAYRGGRPERIVELMAQACFSALANGRRLVSELREIRSRWGDAVTARRDSVAWRLADLVLRQPVVDSALVQRELGATSANVGRAIRVLVEAGVLAEFTDRRRNRLWQASEVLGALDAFADRAARRR